MHTKTISQADFDRGGLFIDHASVFVVLILALMFAATISSAVAPRPIVDPLTAAVQGGL